MKVKSLSHVRLLATPWTAAYQAPPSMGDSRQEYWSGVPLPSPEIGIIIPNLYIRKLKVCPKLREIPLFFLIFFLRDSFNIKWQS